MALATALVLAAPTWAAANERSYDGYEELLDFEARAAMDKGDYKRAEHLFWRLVEIDPRDARALREAGRTAYALGDFTYAEKALARVDELRGGAADPEIHYIRAQALQALGRDKEAEQELARAEEQLAPNPPDRISTLWLARIYAVRGQLDKAEALYRTMLDPDVKSAAYAEIMTYVIEAHIFAKDWKGAERMLRSLLLDQPDHQGAIELLAWVLEARGRIDEELALRKALTEEWRDHPRRVLSFARALERAQDYPQALAQYRAAESLRAGDLSLEIRRLDHRLSPEVAAGVVLSSDPSGNTVGWRVGATVPLAQRWRMVVTGAHDTADATQFMEGVASSTLGLAVVRARRGLELVAGATVQALDGFSGARPGGLLALRTPQGKLVQFQLTLEAQAPWRESASTIREQGVVDVATGQLYLRPFGERIVLSLAAQARRMGLAPLDEMPMPHGNQLFGAAGLDFLVWNKPGRQARGEILDESMLWGTGLSSGLTLSYRHYEFLSDDPFGSRLVLVERSQVDEGSFTLRHVFDAAGVLAVEVRGGVGNDWLRDVRLWRAGGALLLSVASATRLTASFDTASQTGAGIPGARHTGWISFHVDL